MKNAVEELIQALNRHEPLVAMLAPSFPIMYEYPKIIGKLKRLGFAYVVEVAAGAEKTNELTKKALSDNPQGKFITNPCPTIVRLIRTKYPKLLAYLLKVDSPMVSTARLVQNWYPDHQPVFIGPCITKKYEAAEDYSGLKILVLTFKELDEVFKRMNLSDDESDIKAYFDMDWSPTRLYPLSGGLVQSCGLAEVLTKEEVSQISGPANCEKALSEFEKSPVKLLDILWCEGGCIGGPGIESPLTLEERRQKVINFWESVQK